MVEFRDGPGWAAMQVGGGGRGKGVVQSRVERGGREDFKSPGHDPKLGQSQKKRRGGKVPPSFFYRTKLSFSLLLSFLLLDHCRIVKSDGPS